MMFVVASDVVLSRAPHSEREVTSVLKLVFQIQIFCIVCIVGSSSHRQYLTAEWFYMWVVLKLNSNTEPSRQLR